SIPKKNPFLSRCAPSILSFATVIANYKPTTPTRSDACAACTSKNSVCSARRVSEMILMPTCGAGPVNVGSAQFVLFKGVGQPENNRTLNLCWCHSCWSAGAGARGVRVERVDEVACLQICDEADTRKSESERRTRCWWAGTASRRRLVCYPPRSGGTDLPRSMLTAVCVSRSVGWSVGWGMPHEHSPRRGERTKSKKRFKEGEKTHEQPSTRTSSTFRRGPQKRPHGQSPQKRTRRLGGV
ncbi:hypothetical protein B0H11DRAFT_2357080, partial [Mycena galericulata]